MSWCGGQSDPERYALGTLFSATLALSVWYILKMLSQDVFNGEKILRLWKTDFPVTFPKVPSYRLMKYGIKVFWISILQNRYHRIYKYVFLSLKRKRSWLNWHDFSQFWLSSYLHRKLINATSHDISQCGVYQGTMLDIFTKQIYYLINDLQ